MIQIKTAQNVVPMIYAYTTPEIARHDGWTKIGYTEQTVDKRIGQQAHTVDVIFKEEWRGNATFDDGSGEMFKDSDFHRYLSKLGYDRNKGTEWFRISGADSRTAFYDFRVNRGVLKQLEAVIPYALRDEQEKAVSKAISYFNANENGEFLWNAKPRFGKSLSAYDLCKRMNAQKILIVTNRPAIANSWYSDYEKFLGPQSGYYFISTTEALQGKKYVINQDKYIELLNSQPDDEEPYRRIDFVSLQDLKGSVYFGGKYDKLEHVAHLNWDVLIIDEAHEGVDTYKTDVAFNQINRKFTLHLSGTPFKALANDKFPKEAIFNWTYADEQKNKRDFEAKDGETNPYYTLPKLNMFTYQMSEIVKDEISRGIEIDDETENYAFDLNEFFAVKGGKFVHESSVDKFLDALTKQTKFPFSTDELRKELKHTFWILNRVDSAKALAKKLEEHPVFKDYKIVLAAGDGKLDEAEENQKSFDKVTAAIKEYDKTITLSVGQLTTGVTIPEWTAVLMLSSMKSPALYMQSAFRAQNPCLFKENGKFLRKENAYVFDFDPARTLIIFEEFANDLKPETSDGRGDADSRKQNIRELLNFFPVIGEDENGEMIELDAEKVMTIPRKIRSLEVVRRGFMSDFLFQNISHIFHAPSSVIEILENLTPVGESKPKELPMTEETANELSVDENGEVTLSDEYVIGKAADVFGDKLYEDIGEEFIDNVSKIQTETPHEKDETLERLKEIFHEKAVKPIINKAQEAYSDDLKVSEQKRLEKSLKEDGDRLINQTYGDFSIKNNINEKEREEALKQAKPEEVAEINKKFDEKQKEITDDLMQALSETVTDFVKTSSEKTVEKIETEKKKKEKATIEDDIRDRLRGFSRTIPSFLMAYGTEDVTLETFDTIIPDDVFKEVTSITLEQFRFLRDGGDYIESETGEEKHFEGHLFDSVVFNDSVIEFLRLREKLANYFDENNEEDIFDYIPPQKTNQIFTPKTVVKKMVDMLEEENPGCFDDPNKTFIDLYMKSGLYITEIVKRLYHSSNIKAIYPDNNSRLKHIFSKQVYGLAPTEIIYRIALRFILGFDESAGEITHNLRHFDALPYAKDGTLEHKLDELFDGGVH